MAQHLGQVIAAIFVVFLSMVALSYLQEDKPRPGIGLTLLALVIAIIMMWH